MTQPGYLRHLTLHRETIVFVSDDDLWSVGRLRRRGPPPDGRDSRSRPHPVCLRTANGSRSSDATSSIPRSI